MSHETWTALPLTRAGTMKVALMNLDDFLTYLMFSLIALIRNIKKRVKMSAVFVLRKRLTIA